MKTEEPNPSCPKEDKTAQKTEITQLTAQVSHTAMEEIAPSDSEWRQQQNQPNAPVLPDELIPEVLSFLDVKTLLKLRCVCKSWKSLISGLTFVQLHLKRSERNPQLALYTRELESDDLESDDEFAEWDSVVTFPIRSLLDNQLNTLPNDPCYQLIGKDCVSMVDSRNGLICLQGVSLTDEDDIWFRFWNPATRKISEKLGYLRIDYGSCFHYMFGYDKSSDTYKLVTLHLFAFQLTQPGTQPRTEVKVFSLSDNVWRVIHSLPLVPMLPICPYGSSGGDFRGSLNWLALRTDIATNSVHVWENVIVEQFVISSLDLATETCTQFMPPPSFNEVPHIDPNICVLVDCLCFSHDVKGTHLIIWKMTEFGVHESWTQFLKISYQNLDIDYDFGNLENRYNGIWKPLHISANSDTVIFSQLGGDTAIIYNRRDNRVKKTRVTQETSWFDGRNYVESLVSPL